MLIDIMNLQIYEKIMNLLRQLVMIRDRILHLGKLAIYVIS